MIGLMKKDFYNVGSSLKIYFLIPLLFAVLGYQDGSISIWNMFFRNIYRH